MSTYTYQIRRISDQRYLAIEVADGGVRVTYTRHFGQIHASLAALYTLASQVTLMMAGGNEVVVFKDGLPVDAFELTDKNIMQALSEYPA